MLHLLDPERAYREALKAADDVAATPTDAAHAQARATMIAYALLSGEPSYETAIDRGFALLESTRAEQRFIGHILLTLTTLQTVPPDPYRMPLDAATLEGITRNRWDDARVRHPGDDFPMLAARAVAARSRAKRDMAMIHAMLAAFVTREVSHGRFAAMIASPVEPEAIRDEFANLTFLDLKREFAPNRIF